MAVYVQEYKREEAIKLNPRAKNDDTRRITLTDAEKINVENLKLPLGNIQPKYIALLCADTEEDAREHKFTVKQVIDKIDSIDRYYTCEHLPQPHVRMTGDSKSGTFFYEIGFEVTFNFL